MVATRKFVDLEDKPDLADVVRNVHSQGEPVVLREAGQKLAALVPMSDTDESESGDSSREERHKRLMELAGSMKGLVDEEKLYEIYRSRSISTRPPVELSRTYWTRTSLSTSLPVESRPSVSLTR